MPTDDALRRLIGRIDGRGYKAYGELRGHHGLGDLELFVDHVQGDPFAAPSKLRLRVPAALVAMPPEWIDTRVRRIAVADFLARAVRRAIEATSPPSHPIGGRRHGRDFRDAGGRGPGSGRSGTIHIDAGGQEVLERSAVRIGADFVEARIEVGLPAAGRRILGREAETLLLDRLPRIASLSLHATSRDDAEASRHVFTVANHAHVRDALAERGLVAFVADGAILPRESGASARPMPAERAVPFRSPDTLRVEMPLVHAIDGPSGPSHAISGMGVPRGVTVIVGGGYHGKSTLLRAIERGIHPHVPGDGREYVVSSGDLVKIRAEDGRAVTGVDIHAFIDRLPAPFAGDDDDATTDGTRRFSTREASGSTSQAAAIAEAVEAGATGLLLDEDTSATNFMLRDARMQQLVHADHEPITPFVDRVRELYERLGVSTVLVMGGSGDYFDVADTVVMLRDYVASEVTGEARAIAERAPTGRRVERREPLEPFAPRVPLASSFDASKGRREVRIGALGRELLEYGAQRVDLRAVTQLVDASQTRAIAAAIHLASRRFMSGSTAGEDAPRTTLAEVLDRLEGLLDTAGLDVLDPFRRDPSHERHPGLLARPRRHEIAAALNRMRSLAVVPVARPRD